MARRRKPPAIVREFEKYFGTGTLEDWQRLCRDIGIGGDLSSITKCRKALRRVHINIHDLLEAVKRGQTPHRFASVQELAAYTVRERKMYPKHYVKEMGPVKALLRCIMP
ncbi:hypothetical protein VTK26DRAFT_6849 [Humicola hyalothermophila]